MTSHDTSMTVAAVQMRATPQDVSGNLAKADALINRAANGGAKLALLPELFNVGYFIGPELFELWEGEDGRTVTWMREQASQRGMLVAGSIAERRGDRLFNTMFIAEPDGAVGRYSKRQPYRHELVAFDASGDDGIISTSLGRTGCVICADVNWGKTLLRPLAGLVDVVLMPQASTAPKSIGRRMWQREIKRGRPLLGGVATAIGAPLIVAGLIGPTQRITRLLHSYLFGGTWIIDPSGHSLANVPFDEEGVAIADIRLGSTGGNPTSNVFRDPGFIRALADSLIIDGPNLRHIRPPIAAVT
jgi:predicted amidohydrolase